jgi:hypothetical protein
MPAWELTADTLSVFFNLKEAVNLKPRFRRPMYCGVDTPYIGLVVHIFVHPV